MTAEEARTKFPVGARVKRGPDWEFHNQDCDENGNQTIGTTTRHPIDYGGIGWRIGVKWDGNRDINIYRISDKKHIVLVSNNIVNSSAPRNNDGRAVCFWCPNTNTQKRGGGVYDICPKCGK